jgi:hypothetical protein
MQPRASESSAPGTGHPDEGAWVIGLELMPEIDRIDIAMIGVSDPEAADRGGIFQLKSAENLAEDDERFLYLEHGKSLLLGVEY